MRRSLRPRPLLVALVAFLLAIALPACSSQSSLSSACQDARVRFVEMENTSAEATRATVDSLNHYSDAFNGVTSGRVPSGSPQYQATMDKMQADKQASLTALAAAREKGSSFRAAVAACDTLTLPKGCLPEWNHFKVSLGHEVREADAGKAAVAAATSMVAVWNAAGARATAATRAAVDQFNAAGQTLAGMVDEHNRLTDQYRSVQQECSKAAKG